MIPVKLGESVIAGNKNKIQIFELNSKKLKELIIIEIFIGIKVLYYVWWIKNAHMSVGKME